MTAKQRPPASDQGGADDDGRVSNSLPTTADIASAYCVYAHTPYDRKYRRLFLSLHSAVQAVERARKRGLPAELVLCRLVPVQGNLELDDGEVTK
jgi:hypothetical protein